MNSVDKPLSWLKKYENNPRDNKNAVAAVKASIKEFGFLQPIVAEEDGTIIVGHTRYEAATQLGLKTVPVIVAKGLTPAKIKAYRLADNKVGEIAQWDDDRLMLEIAELMQDGSIDLGSLGFSQEDLGLIEKAAKTDTRWLEDFDVLPVPKPKWILVMAKEDTAAEIASELRQTYKGTGVVIHYSGEAA